MNHDDSSGAKMLAGIILLSAAFMLGVAAGAAILALVAGG